MASYHTYPFAARLFTWNICEHFHMSLNLLPSIALMSAQCSVCVAVMTGFCNPQGVGGAVWSLPSSPPCGQQLVSSLVYWQQLPCCPLGFPSRPLSRSLVRTWFGKCFYSTPSSLPLWVYNPSRLM